MSKKVLRFQLVFYACFILILLAVFVYFMMGYGFSFNLDRGAIMSNFDQSYQVESTLNLIEVDTSQEDIEFLYHDDDRVRVVYLSNKSSNKHYPIVSQDESSIQVESDYNKKIFNFSFFNNSNHIRYQIYIPRSYQGAIKLKSVSGDIKVAPLNSLVLTTHSTSGDILINSCEGCQLNTKSVSGDIEIKQGKYQLTASTTSGDIEAEGLISQFDLNSVSGDIEINSQLMMETDSEASTVSGVIEIHIPENEGYETTYSSTTGQYRSRFSNVNQKKKGIDIYKNGEIKFKFKTVSGEISIN